MAKIMIVDDEQPILMVLSVLAGSMGHETLTFQDPAEAMKFIASETPVDLVLCDLRMTEISGMDVLKEVREQWPRVPVIMVSAYLTGDRWREAQELGAFDGLTKPFQADVLKQKIDSALAGDS